jgi:hypothetical protein
VVGYCPNPIRRDALAASPRKMTPATRGGTTGAPAPTAIGSTASSAATPGCWPSSHSRRRCGTRSAGSCGTRRVWWKSTGGASTLSRAAHAGTSSTSWRARGDKLRHALGRLIDGYAEGLIAKHEFEPRIAEMRRRMARLDAEMAALCRAEQQTRSFQLVIGKLSVFAEMVHDHLETADWPRRSDIVRTLVKRIEVTDDVVRIVFRVEPGSSEPLPTLPHCQTDGHSASHAARRQRVSLVSQGASGCLNRT